MPVVEQGVHARLAGSTAVNALAGTRIYALQIPQNPTFPCATYELIGAERESVMSADTGQVHARVQVTSWAKTYTAASALSEAVRTTLQRWSGTSTGVVIDEVFIEDEGVFFDETTATHAHVLDLMVHYQE